MTKPNNLPPTLTLSDNPNESIKILAQCMVDMILHFSSNPLKDWLILNQAMTTDIKMHAEEKEAQLEQLSEAPAKQFN